MTPAEFFARSRALPRACLDDLLAAGGAVVIAPHPDDESLGCGALIAEAVRAGRSVRIIIVSDGTGSHPNSKSFPFEGLRALRESETINAASALGLPPEAVRFLRLPDRFVPATGEAAKRAVEEIVSTARTTGASALFVSWRLDPHCDHRAAYALVREAQGRLDGVRLFEYVIWGERLPLDKEPQGEPRGFRFDAERHRVVKLAAVKSHRSQTSRLIDDDPDGFMLDPAMVEAFIAEDEVFLEMEA